MTKPRTRLKALGSILDLCRVKRYLFAVDNRYYLYILDTESNTPVKKVRLAAGGKSPVHRYAKTFVIARSGEVVVSFGGSNRLGVFRPGKGGGSQGVASWHRSDIEAVAVSQQGWYASGGSDGKVFLYRGVQTGPVGSFEPRGEYISHLVFSPDGRFLASSAFDKTIHIYDLKRHREVAVFGTGATVEHAVFFDGGRKLYAVTREGGSICYDIQARQLLSDKALFDVWPTTVTLSENGKVAAVGAKDNRISLVKLAENKKVCDFQTDLNGITRIRLDGGKMLVAGIDGRLLEYDCSAASGEFEAGIREKDFHKAKEALEQNPLLYLNPLLEEFDACWSDVLKEAIRLLSIGECDAGCSIVQPFLDDPERVEEFNFYLLQKEVFVNFIRFVETGRYKDAYALAGKEHYLQRISQYEEMEKLWERTFRAAQKSLETNPGNRERAKEMLRPFSRVNAKEKMIRQLLENSDRFAQAEALVRTMRFGEFFELANAYEFLREAGIYKKVLQVGENLYRKLLQCEEERAFERYYKIAETLKLFPPYRETVVAGVKRGRIKERFIRSVAEEDLHTAFSLLEKHDHLMLEGEYEYLLKDFESVLKEAEKRLIRGAEALELKEVFAGYITIPYWQERIAQVMREGYINELRSLTIEGEGDAQLERATREYMRLFTKDDVLLNFMRSKGFALWLEGLSEGSSTMGYRRGGFPNTILV